MDDLARDAGYPRKAQDDADKARAALQAYAGPTAVREDPETALSDLLADLRHYCDASGIDYGAADASAEMHHAAETC